MSCDRFSVADALSGVQADTRHAAECDACGELLRSARLHQTLLGALGRPKAPEALEAASFLPALHDRLNQRSEASVRALFESALPRVEAPQDTALPAGEQEPSGVIIGALRSLPPRRAPGWLWSRIRGELQTRRAVVQRQRVRRIALRAGLAAALLIASLALFGPNANESVEVVPEFVVIPQDSSFSPFSAPSIVRELTRD